MTSNNATVRQTGGKTTGAKYIYIYFFISFYTTYNTYNTATYTTYSYMQ